jgi:alcohol dehydrogenase class IV
MNYRKLCKRLIIALRLEREERKEQAERLQAEMRDLREEFRIERHWRRLQEKEREAKLDVLVQKLIAANRRGDGNEVERLADLLSECVSV